MTLEEMLAEISKLGRSSIFEHEDQTWSCSIKLRIVMPGGNYEIKSGYGHSTCTEAVAKSLEYLRATFKAMKEEIAKIEQA